MNILTSFGFSGVFGVVSDGPSVGAVTVTSPTLFRFSSHSFSRASSFTLYTASTMVAIANAPPTKPNANANLLTAKATKLIWIITN